MGSPASFTVIRDPTILGDLDLAVNCVMELVVEIIGRFPVDPLDFVAKNQPLISEKSENSTSRQILQRKLILPSPKEVAEIPENSTISIRSALG